MQACFIGHRKIQKKEELASSIKQTVLTLIQKGITTFLFGSKSEFDDLAWQVVSDLKITYPFIKRIYVRSAYPYLNKAYDNLHALPQTDAYKSLIAAYEGAFVGFQIGLSPIKAPFIGLKSVEYVKMAVQARRAAEAARKLISRMR